MPRRYKQGADGQPHPAFYGKLPEEFSKADTMRFMVETDLKLSGCVSADTLTALRAEGYDYKDGNLVPAGKEETMQERRDLLETVQGYVILKAATFETGHGFALALRHRVSVS